MFTMGLRKSVPLFATMMLVSAGGLALVAAPAEAASKCSAQNEKSFDLPGKPDVWVGIILCIDRTSAGNGHAFANIQWDGSFLGGKRFDKFELQVRIERYDSVFDDARCSFTTPLNNRIEGGGECGGAVWTSSAKGGWSADGTVTYNVNSDGKGDMTWELHGSPLVD